MIDEITNRLTDKVANDRKMKQLAEQTVDAGENRLTELDTDRLRDLLLLA